MTPGVVRVHRVGLDVEPHAMAGLDGLLAPAERDAPAPVRVARAATRIVLGRALGLDPRSVPISRACVRCGDPAHGRPTVVGDPVSFSVSHTGTLAVIAVGAGALRVGVDAEAVRPRTRLDPLAQRVLDEAEYARWRSIPGADERLHAFLRAWTAKEAYLKAIGLGIVTRLRDVSSAMPGWHTRDLDIAGPFVGTLVTDAAVDVEAVEVSLPITSSDGTAR